MKHSNFYQLYKNVQALERKELIAAVKAHGGIYEFAKEDEESGDIDTDSCPIVNGNTRHMESPADFYITKVEVETTQYGEYLVVYGMEKEDPYEVKTIQVESGNLHYIIDEIPATDQVVDVSMPMTMESLLANNIC